jgi:uncharacterized membrane protein YphA (DoxX/SURF4 family)
LHIGRVRFEGRYLYALMIALFGAIWLVSGDFVDVWQPVSDSLPARQAIVYGSGLAFLVSAAALAYRPTSRVGSVAPIIVFLLFVWRWVTRIILLPKVAGTWSGCGEEVIPVIAAVVILTTDRVSGLAPPRVVGGCRILFGLFAVAFGLVHFEALEQTAQMVPAWIPGSGAFWARATGVAHAAGGVALIIGFRPRLAARLLAAMYLVFELLIWIPNVWTAPDQPITWMGNALTVLLAASALVLADALRTPIGHGPTGDTDAPDAAASQATHFA